MDSLLKPKALTICWRVLVQLKGYWVVSEKNYMPGFSYAEGRLSFFSLLGSVLDCCSLVSFGCWRVLSAESGLIGCSLSPLCPATIFVLFCTRWVDEWLRHSLDSSNIAAASSASIPFRAPVLFVCLSSRAWDKPLCESPTSFPGPHKLSSNLFLVVLHLTCRQSPDKATKAKSKEATWSSNYHQIKTPVTEKCNSCVHKEMHFGIPLPWPSVEFRRLSSFVKKGLKKFLSIAVNVAVLTTSRNDPQKSA